MTNEPSQPLLVRMPADLHAAVKEAAAAEDRSMAQFVREAVRDRVANQAGQQRKRS